MAENSKIEWTKHTWNFIIGCHKVSPGCKFCYAEKWVNRFGEFMQGSGEFREIRRTAPKTFYAPLRLHKSLTGQEPIQERLVFTCSLSDVFLDHRVANEARKEMWDIIRQTPNLIYQILTKRPERVMNNVPEDWGDGWPNVWIGTSVENQEIANKRLPELHRINAAVKFVSFEPLLGPIDLTGHLVVNKDRCPECGYTHGVPVGVGDEYTGTECLNCDSYMDTSLSIIDWAIIGGESGGPDKSRRCEYEWIIGLKDQLQKALIPTFVKQMGSDIARRYNMSDAKGGKMEEFPQDLRIREFPKFKTMPA